MCECFFQSSLMPPAFPREGRHCSRYNISPPHNHPASATADIDEVPISLGIFINVVPGVPPQHPTPHPRTQSTPSENIEVVRSLTIANRKSEINCIASPLHDNELIFLRSAALALL